MKYMNDEILAKSIKSAKLKATPGTRSFRTAVGEALTTFVSEEYDDVKKASICDKGVLISFNNSPDKIIPMSFRQLKVVATQLFGKDTDEYREFMGG